MRDLRDKIQYPPVAGKYKVYIVDEVHMLTAEAFNALLKTLEEPPEHAVFILATTEVQKLPATILSRCLRFDFKLISTEEIEKHIAEIYDKIGKKYQKEAIDLIARAGEGSMRDALSVADVCVSYSDGVLTYDDVLEVLGASDRGEIEKLAESILTGDTGGVLTRLETLCKRGKSVGVLNRDVCGVLRDLLIVKTCSDAQKILGLPQDKFEEFKKIAVKGDSHGILRAIEIFSACEADLKYSTHPRIVFETAALKASLPESDYNIDALISKVNSLENEIKRLSAMPLSAATANAAAGATVTANVNKVEKTVSVEKDTVSANNQTVKTAETYAAPEKVTKKVEEKPAEKTSDYGEEDLPEPPPENFEFGGDFTISPPGGPIDEGFGYPPIKNKKAPTENIEKPAYKPVNATFGGENEPQSKGENKGGSVALDGTDPRKAWGAILKKLRDDKEIMLWVACQDVSSKIAGGKFYVIASGQSEYNLLSKPANAQKLGEYVKNECGLSLEVVDDAAKISEEPSSAATSAFGENGAGTPAQNDQTEDFSAENVAEQKEVNAVKNFFGDENVEITD